MPTTGSLLRWVDWRILVAALPAVGVIVAGAFADDRGLGCEGDCIVTATGLALLAATLYFLIAALVLVGRARSARVRKRRAWTAVAVVLLVLSVPFAAVLWPLIAGVVILDVLRTRPWRRP